MNNYIANNKVYINGTMGEENIVLIQIKVSEEQVKEKVLANREALIRLKAEAKATKAEFDKGIITARQYAESQRAIETQIKAAKEEVKKGEATIKSYADTQKKAEVITKGVSQSLKTAIPFFRELTAAQEEHITLTKAVSDRIQELSDQFKVEEASIKANVSSIDTLGESIAELRMLYSGLSQAQREDINVGGKLLALEADLTRQEEKHQRTIDNSKKTLKDYIGDIDILGFNVGQTVESFKSGAQGAGLFAKSIFTSRGALIALTAVPIIALLSGLYIILTKSQKGMDFLARATAGFSSILSAISSKVIAVGEALANAWDNPTQAVKDFGSAIVNSIINRFKAVGVIIDALKQKDFGKLADGVVQLGTGAVGAATKLKNAYDAGAKLADLSIQIKEEEIKLNTERARSEKYIERQKQIAEDATKSTQKRSTAAKAAFAESQKIQNAEEALQKKRVKLAEDEAKQNQGNREYRLKVSEEQAKLDEIAKNRIGERTELQNQLNSIEAEGAAKALENARKIEAEKVAIAEEALVQAKKNGEDTVEIEAEILKRTIVLIQAKANAEKVAVEAGRGAAAQRKLIQTQADAEILEATKQTAQKVAEIVYSVKIAEINSTLALTRKGTKEELDLHLESINAERIKQQQALLQRETQLKQNLKDRLLTEEQYKNAYNDLQIEIGNVANTAARAASDARLEYEKSLVGRESDLANQKLQIQLDLGDQSLSNERDVATQRIDLEEKVQLDLLEIEKKYNQLSDKEYEVHQEAIKDKAIAARKELNKQIAEADLTNEKAINDAKLLILRDGSKAQLKVLLDNLAIERQQKIDAAKGDAKAIQAIEDDYNNKRLKANEEYRKKLSEQVVDIANQAISTLTSIVDAQVASQTSALDQRYQAELSSVALTADARAKIEAEYQKKKDDVEKKANQKKAKIATAQNLINGALAITKAFAELGPIGGAIATAFIAAQVVAQQVVIDNQSGKFAKGGYLEGPSHAEGGIKYRLGNRNIELEGGEAIINKKSTAENYALLSAINSSNNNGRAFPGIRPSIGRTFDISHAVPKFAYGGVATSLETEAITNAIIKGMQGVNIRVGVDQITRVQRDVKQAEVRADS
ncbi:hypothetical protein [Spirosoma foliorum]|uniref:Uncharacterized protein n=1 Tax=Spirosoma foliorum TaxID=2710596 RepID=A0A7G5GTV5_9BACT|nr:hypothetical protein [Spirosoma foliorum]QMW02297.1 hypothetical protein H3H32_30970 [Spirosoma foliorum]